MPETRGMRKGKGCAACRGTGFRGRVGTFELLMIDEGVRSLIQSRATAAQIKEAGVLAGMRTLRDDGVAKILAGVTTTSEVERVTMRPEGEEGEGITGVPPVQSAMEVE